MHNRNCHHLLSIEHHFGCGAVAGVVAGHSRALYRLRGVGYPTDAIQRTLEVCLEVVPFATNV